MTSGRKPIGEQAMTAAERKRRQRAKAKDGGIPTRDQLITAFGRAVMDLTPEIASTPTFERIEQQTAHHLSNLGFNRRPINQLLKRVKEGGGTSN